MAQSVQVQKTLSPYKNQNLFSRHYLNKVIERTEIWDIDEEELEDAFEELEEIYNEQKQLLPHRTEDEEEVRNEFITPILRRVLDFKKEQEKKSGNSQRIPDYALYDTIEKKKKAVETQEYYKHAIGLVEAKAWKKDLEKKTSTGDMSTEDSNPTKQIVDYLIENDPQWGVLTNGKKWRLVHREASNRLDTYYEVDIENLLTSERPREERLEEFKYFYIFFRKQAFQGDEGDKVLDEILEESLQYAEEIGEDLEENIYQALEWLAKGYLENGSNTGIEDEPIEKIHDNSLIYLYRLLFALYADSRGILGDPGGQYEYYNFSSLVDDVCEKIDSGEGYGKTGKLRNRLDAIFRMIDEGSQSRDIPKEELHIPAYNGGLFNQDKHDFLKEYNLHDKYLAKVIDLVARTDMEEGGKAQVDYYDLSVRHLGGIYEGLLEYQLRKADEDLVEVSKSGDTVMMELEKAEEKNKRFDEDTLVEERDPYLVTDDGKRKSTGSYYTPDYIVKYLVENSVEPRVEEKVSDKETDEEKAQAILDMKILDPALGSAHFLVEVIDYLASKLVDYREIEIEQAKREVAKKCVYGVDVNPLATELGKLSIWLTTISEDKPLSFLNHHIKTGNSLVGADIQLLNKHPEEITDEDIEKLKQNPEDEQRQSTLGEEFENESSGVVRANVKKMLEMFKQIQEEQEDNPEDIKKKQDLYDQFLDFPFRKRFEILADVHTSYYYENEFSVDDYNRLLQAFKLKEQKEDEDEKWEDVTDEEWVEKAAKEYKDEVDNNLSADKYFFHWKLEFPEVFFDIEEGVEKQNAGFDAVVGNPPYVKLQNLPKEDRHFRELPRFKVTNQGSPDLYVPFIESGRKLLKHEGIFGMILPNRFFKVRYGKPLRKMLTEDTLMKEVVNFSHNQIFDEATTYTNLLFLQEGERESFQYYEFDHIEEKERRRKLLSKDFEYIDFSYDMLDKRPWIIGPPEVLKTIEDLDEHTTPLDDMIDSISVGIQTSADPIYILELIEEREDHYLAYSEETDSRYELEKGPVRKIISGDDAHRYSMQNSKVVIFPYEIEDGEPELMEEETLAGEYPEVYFYLKECEEDIRGRENGKMDHEDWYAYVYPKNLGKQHLPKITIPQIVPKIRAGVDENGEYALHNVNVSGIFTEEELDLFYLPAILNSALMVPIFRSYSQEMRGGYYGSNKQFVERLPVVKNENISVDPDEELVQELEEVTGSEVSFESPDEVKSAITEMAKETISYYDSRNEEIERFLRWIRRDWEVDIPNLSLKSKLREYYEYDFDELYRVAKKNKSDIDGDVKSSEFMDRLEEEFDKSMKKLNKLDSQTQDLENLIDAIVLDLYDIDKDRAKDILEYSELSQKDRRKVLRTLEKRIE